jgi:hypothetical protein
MWMHFLVEKGEQPSGFNDEPCLLMDFLRGNLKRRVSDVCPSTRERPSTLIALLADQQDFAAVSNNYRSNVYLRSLVSVFVRKNTDELLERFISKLLEERSWSQTLDLYASPA